MKPDRRRGKLTLATQTMRVLTDQQLVRVGGAIAGTYGKCTAGKYTADPESCSTIAESNPNCIPD